MTLAFDVVKLGLAMMASLVAWHFVLEMIDYWREERVLKQMRPASPQNDQGTGSARTEQAEPTISPAGLP